MVTAEVDTLKGTIVTWLTCGSGRVGHMAGLLTTQADWQADCLVTRPMSHHYELEIG
jgi:hypothetical protein